MVSFLTDFKSEWWFHTFTAEWLFDFFFFCQKSLGFGVENTKHTLKQMDTVNLKWKHWLPAFICNNCSFLCCSSSPLYFRYPIPLSSLSSFPTRSSHTRSTCEIVVIRLTQWQVRQHCVRTEWLPLVGSVWLPSVLLWISCTLNSAPFSSLLCTVAKNSELLCIHAQNY